MGKNEMYVAAVNGTTHKTVELAVIESVLDLAVRDSNVRHTSRFKDLFKSLRRSGWSFPSPPLDAPKPRAVFEVSPDDIYIISRITSKLCSKMKDEVRDGLANLCTKGWVLPAPPPRRGIAVVTTS